MRLLWAGCLACVCLEIEYGQGGHPAVWGPPSMSQRKIACRRAAGRAVCDDVSKRPVVRVVGAVGCPLHRIA